MFFFFCSLLFSAPSRETREMSWPATTRCLYFRDWAAVVCVVLVLDVIFTLVRLMGLEKSQSGAQQTGSHTWLHFGWPVVGNRRRRNGLFSYFWSDDTGDIDIFLRRYFFRSSVAHNNKRRTGPKWGGIDVGSEKREENKKKVEEEEEEERKGKRRRRCVQWPDGTSWVESSRHFSRVCVLSLFSDLMSRWWRHAHSRSTTTCFFGIGGTSTSVFSSAHDQTHTQHFQHPARQNESQEVLLREETLGFALSRSTSHKQK